MNVTIKDIARLSGVSYSTVSKALNNSPLVKENTKKKVLEVAQKLGYQPNIAAQSLVSKKSRTIGLLWPTVERVAVSSLATKINEELEKHSYSMILSINPIDSAISLFNRFNVDGILVFDESMESDRPNISSIAPVLCYGESGTSNIPFLDINRKKAILDAVHYLGGLGHQKISYIGDLSERKIQQEKYFGFTKGVFELGLQVDPYMAVDSHGLSWNHGYEAVMDLLDSSYKPTAIISGSYDLTVGIMRAIKEHQLNIPEDISLISYDNIPQLETLDVPVTAVGAPINEIAKTIVYSLLSIIQANESKIPTKPFISPQSVIVERASCKRMK